MLQGFALGCSGHLLMYQFKRGNTVRVTAEVQVGPALSSSLIICGLAFVRTQAAASESSVAASKQRPLSAVVAAALGRTEEDAQPPAQQ